MKVCARCRDPKPTGEFADNRSKKDGKDEYCKACRNEYRTQYRLGHPLDAEAVKQSGKRYYQKHRNQILRGCKRRWRDRGRESHLQQKFGIGEREYKQLLKLQGGLCALCGRKSRAKLVVDHDHSTGRIRKLLCHSCNLGLGLLGDSPDRLRAGADYIENYRSDQA